MGGNVKPKMVYGQSLMLNVERVADALVLPQYVLMSVNNVRQGGVVLREPSTVANEQEVGINLTIVVSFAAIDSSLVMAILERSR
jgi:hypothetical protein